MKKIKRIGLCLITLLLVIGLVGCQSSNNANVEGTLEEIMTKVYANIAEEDRPMMLTNIEITTENIENFLGTADISFKEALASEPAVSSIAHSVVLVRLADEDVANIEAIKTKIKENVNPRKWMCVEAEEVKVESKGNLIILIMADRDSANKIDQAFKNL